MRATLTLLASLLTTVPLIAQRTPLNDLGNGKYLGQFEGSLYEHGANVPPADHEAIGLAQAALVRPLDRDGHPSPNGKIVMVSVGMSNTTQEFCAAGNPSPCTSWSFVGQANADPAVNHATLVLINGARGGQAADSWESPTQPDWDGVKTNLTAAGLTEAQVQVAWIKQANKQPATSLPSSSADAYRLAGQLGNIARALKVRYPNIRLAYFSSRIYAGYANTTLNPEPYAYETAFAVKWLIEAQVAQERSGTADTLAGDLGSAAAPWLAWSAYLWADGLNPRSDGLTWARSELESDGTHPAQAAEQKVGSMLLAFFKSDPTTKSWFVAAPPQRRRAAHH
ncbi:MAG TPA: hypothetical protein VG323_00540 [Thermoanaerobaculia bacterium]|nr:hypothetical protein [Thermoanaerobaculia bacterium]